mgnify:CR=1 FL=1
MAGSAKKYRLSDITAFFTLKNFNLQNFISARRITPNCRFCYITHADNTLHHVATLGVVQRYLMKVPCTSSHYGDVHWPKGDWHWPTTARVISNRLKALILRACFEQTNSSLHIQDALIAQGKDLNGMQVFSQIISKCYRPSSATVKKATSLLEAMDLKKFPGENVTLFVQQATLRLAEIKLNLQMEN